MPDREKVIKGLESCASMNGSACRECPYSSECVEDEATYQTGTAHLAADALALLKEQPEIVRCKDCNHRYKKSCGYYYADGQIMHDDWFCADGKRSVKLDA